MKRLRPLVAGPVRALDHAIGRRLGRRHVVFDARLPVHFVVVRPVLELLRRDPRVDVWVCSAEGRADTIAAFDEAGFADRLLTREGCAWRRFDLYINGDPWCVAPLRRCSGWINFFHGVAGKYGLDQPPADAHLFDRYDRVAFVNEDRLRRYLDAGIVTPTQAALVGYPKLDRLATGAFDAAAIRRSLGIPPDRPTVMYAPTWSSASSLHVAGEAIIGTLLESGCNVIAKLHDNCFVRGERCAGDVDWRGRLARFASLSGFHLARSADSTAYMAASDILLTDHSSIGFEALAIDQPVVVFDAPDLVRVARINPEKVAFLRSAADIVTAADQLPRVLEAVLRHPGARAEARRRVASQIFHAPGGATERALRLLYSALELSPDQRAIDLATPVSRLPAVAVGS